MLQSSTLIPKFCEAKLIQHRVALYQSANRIDVGASKSVYTGFFMF